MNAKPGCGIGVFDLPEIGENLSCLFRSESVVRGCETDELFGECGSDGRAMSLNDGLHGE